ncbi:MAG TPA: tRNA glutamyl-Q(34) synthetase GluQRS [Terracidiphilus sp.]|jgi:glutamyl-tRNA synthetase|nr:tRNA glutamyl-Q(34) synthetase GluQRS [Terracidiphilus sp.]
MATATPPRDPDYRGRLAPSPTGLLHMGHARTFWTAFQRARDAGGTLVMRMEDLDPERSRAQYAEAAYEDLRWLGIRWQEGPDLGGPFAPYVQSKRMPVYLSAWRKLYRGGYLFPCKCSRKDLEAALGAPHETSIAGVRSGRNTEPLDDEPIYPGTCRRNQAEHDTPNGMNWRFRVPDGEVIELEDQNLGPQRFVAGVDFGDFAVWRRDGIPSYQLACVADDASMEITEVVRGADLLKSTARQILLYHALGIAAPKWFHCRLMLDQHGRRLAKRNDALSLRTLRQQGLTPMNVLGADVPLSA